MINAKCHRRWPKFMEICRSEQEDKAGKSPVNQTNNEIIANRNSTLFCSPIYYIDRRSVILWITWRATQ